jgi:hypothetical protein
MSANRLRTGKRMPQRKNSRSFQPGHSGNPSGRPALTPQQKAQELELVQACREKSVAALNVIESLMMTADRDSTRLAAAQFIIERGFGKAVQMDENSGGKPTIIEHRWVDNVVAPKPRHELGSNPVITGPSEEVLEGSKAL